MHSQAKPTRPTGMWTLANPTRFLGLADRVIPWLAVLTFLTLGVGLYLAIFVAPPDYQQGETVRIMFLHVPAAWLAMFGYTLSPSPASARSSGATPSPMSRRSPRPRSAPPSFPRARHRLAMGQADVGHLLGVGCAAHLDAGAVPALSRPDRALAVASRSRGGLAAPQPSSRSSASSTCRSSNSRSIGGTRCISRRASSAPAGRPSIRRCSRRSSSWPLASRCCSCVAPHRHARRDPAPPRPCAPPGACRARGGSLRPSLTAMPDLGAHAAFIWAAYAVTFVAVAGSSVDRAGRPQTTATSCRSRTPGHHPALRQAGSQATAGREKVPGAEAEAMTAPKPRSFWQRWGWRCRS